MAFEIRISVDISMNFHLYIIQGKDPAERVRDLDTFGYFHQHPFFDAHFLEGHLVMNVHKASFSFADEDDNGCKLGLLAFNLAVGADANL